MIVSKVMQPLLVTMVVCIIGAIALIGHRFIPLNVVRLQQNDPIPYMYADSAHYINIANGKIAEVPAPYSKRVLFPSLAGHISRDLHLPLGMAFLGLNFMGFALLSYCLAAILQRLETNPWWTVLAMMTPLALESLQRAYLPDLFHMALLALFLLLVAHEMEIWALVVLMAAFLTRDNTLIVCLVLCFTAWRRQKKILFGGGLLVLILGMACDSWFVHLGQPNRHHLPDFLYLALFVPCSFLGNVLGIVIWTNAGGEDGTPLLHWHIPRGLQLGADHDAYLGFDWFRNFETFSALLTLFGCGPLVVWYLWRKMDLPKNWPLVVQFAFTYGLISYFLGTSVGRTGTFRLIGFAWPIFWIALPWLLTKVKMKITPGEAAFLLAASLFVAWVPNFDGLGRDERPVNLWMLGIPVFYVITAICFSRIVRRSRTNLEK